MSYHRNQNLKDYFDELVAQGQHYFITEEIENKLKIKSKVLSVYLSRLAKKKKIKIIKDGFGLILYAHTGELHPSFYLNALMKHLKAKYYVGLLSASAFWGAAHQSSMTYQVVTNKIIKPLTFEKGRIEFIAKQNSFSEIGIQKVVGSGGYFYVSSPELTAIDLLRFPKKAGHLNNVATVLEDLIEKCTKEKMLELYNNQIIPTLSIQRLGFLIDVILSKEKEAKIIDKILSTRKLSRSLLSVSKKDKVVKNLPFNKRWNLYINTTVEPD